MVSDDELFGRLTEDMRAWRTALNAVIHLSDLILEDAEDIAAARVAARDIGAAGRTLLSLFENWIGTDQRKNCVDYCLPSLPCPCERLRGARVLIAEDQRINAEIVKRILFKAGAQVTEATNGQEAVECFRASGENGFDAVLMDVQMPVMDGLSAARAIRSLPRADAKTVPIIALTANAAPLDAECSLACGMDAHLLKPVNPKTLCDTLVKMLGR